MSRKYFVLCEDDCKFEGMTKEQTLAAIAEATGNTPQNVDEAFISKIVNQNGGSLKLWRGTRAEYNALTEKDEAGTIYHITDDKTPQEAWNKAAEAATAAETAVEIASGAAAQSIAVYTHTAGTLTGVGENGKFKATVSETISAVIINGEGYAVRCGEDTEFELVRGAWYTFILDGNTINFKQGGAGLNFSIVGGTTQPASPKENTIWINTDLEITGWAFDTESPNYLSTGGIWLKTAPNGNAKMNIVKKNTIFVSFLYAFQWNGTAFVSKEAKLYANGRWAEMGAIFYADGVQIVPWEVKRKSNGEAIFGNTHISLRATSNTLDMGVTIGTVDPVNFNDIDSIVFNATTISRTAAAPFTTTFVIADDLAYRRPNIAEFNNIARLNVTTANTKENFVIDTRNITGNHFIGIGIDTGMSYSTDPIYIYSCRGE